MTVKALVGYDIMPGVTPEEYDRWLWEIHVPDILSNPYVEKIVFNTVFEPVTTTSGGAATVEQGVKLYRVAEMHYQDLDHYRKYRAWFDEHPIPAERGPAGRSDFKFYLICTVEEATRS
ncbi:MAG: hypothetical protein U0556_18105 [Dehalococcoidia bacterium]